MNLNHASLLNYITYINGTYLNTIVKCPIQYQAWPDVRYSEGWTGTGYPGENLAGYSVSGWVQLIHLYFRRCLSTVFS